MVNTEVRVKRVANGIPAAALARKAGLSETQLYRTEHGLREPSPEELERIELALTELVAVRTKMLQLAAASGWVGRL